MNVKDEIALEDHPYFRARLDHLETQHPKALLAFLETGLLISHLREVTERAMQAQADLIFNGKLPQDQAEELVMNQVVADPREHSRLDDPTQRRRLRLLLHRFKATLPRLPRTYLS